MKVKECAFFSCKDLHGNISEGTCNLFPEESKVMLRYIQCNVIPISKCPYKMYIKGLIDKEELNKRIEEIQKDEHI